MLNFINKRKLMKAQVSVVLILFLALGLMLFAVSANIGKISNSKIDTIIASNTAAAKMASLLAGYGEAQWVQNLGRVTPRCKTHGGFWEFFIGILFAIITLPLTIIQIAIAGDVQLVTGGVFSLDDMSVHYIDPTIAEQWAESLATNFTLLDQTVEQGIQAALQKAINDPVNVPDYEDMDQDKLSGGLLDLEDTDSALDYISRFAFYNTKRIDSAEAPETGSVRAFINSLKNLLYVDDTYYDDVPGTGIFPVTVSSDWGFYDPIVAPHACLPHNPWICATNSPPPECTEGTFPAECDPCCVPDTYPGIFLPGGGIEYITDNRPDCCDDPEPTNRCGRYGNCEARSVYRNGGPTGLRKFPWVYFPFVEDYTDGDYSLRENIGRDDENAEYRKESTDPNSFQNYWEFPNDRIDQKYFIGDTTGYYGNPPEYKRGIFDLFYKLQDWGMQLSLLSYGRQYVDNGNPPPESANIRDDRFECHWCDLDANPPQWWVIPTDLFECPDPGDPYGLPSVLIDELGTHLELYYGPGENDTPPGSLNVAYAGSACVDSFNWRPTGGAIPIYDTINDNPSVLDAVPNIHDLFAEEDECAIGPNMGTNIGWKRGAGKFCTELTDGGGFPQYPYNASCLKHNGDGNPCELEDDQGLRVEYDCPCGDAGLNGEEGTPMSPGPEHRKLWREDTLDAIIYESELFIAEAEPLIQMDIGALEISLRQWYDDAAYWIEPMCTDPDCPDEPGDPIGPGCVCNGSFTKLRRAGRLYVWRDWLQEYLTAISEWGADGTGYVSNEVWCVPLEGSHQHDDAPLEEKATFDADGDLVRGEILEVIECLKWNESDTFVGSLQMPVNEPPLSMPVNPEGTFTATGNAEKFGLCAYRCSNYNCADIHLPRSLVPMVPADKFQRSQEDPYWQQEIYDECLAATTIPQCNNRCGTDSDSAYETSSPDERPWAGVGGPTDNGGYGPWPDTHTWDEPVNIDLIEGLYSAIPFECSLLPPESILVFSCNGVNYDFDCDNLKAEDILPCSCEYLHPTDDNPTTGDADCRHLCANLPELPDFVYNGPSAFHSQLQGLSGMIQEAQNYYGDPDEFTGKEPHLSCNDTSSIAGKLDSPFELLMEESFRNALNQQAKIERRRIFLEKRIEELSDTALMLEDAIGHIEAFLHGPTPFEVNKCENTDEPQDSPAENLICERMGGAKSGLPSTAIYVWKDRFSSHERKDNSWAGYWHAVKVETRVPLRCNSQCRAGGMFTGEQKWPSVGVQVDKHTFSTKICYFMQDEEGMVKARVIKADEDRELSGFKFPGGEGIWDIRLFHPASGPLYPTDLVGTKDDPGDCYWQVDPLLRTKDGNPDTTMGDPDVYWKDAFMLNFPPRDPTDCGEPPDEDPACECWYAVHRTFIEHGVATDTCAEYFLGSEAGAGYGGRGFSLKFVPCDQGFLGGTN